ncbi:MAG: lipoate--protein ligase family protein [Anaerolineae bacterium]
MPEPSVWRLIDDGPRGAALNMAIDEAVLEAVTAGQSLPTLRFYEWRPPTISIGYAQKVADFDLPGLTAAGLGFVRRPSGGRGVLHRHEVTYCICCSDDDWRVAGGVTESYRRLSDGFLAGLRTLGVDGAMAPSGEHQKAASAACFDAPSRYELTATGRKLVGSAQWRSGGGVLQHGSVPINGDVTELVDHLALSEADRQRARDLLWRRAGTVAQAIGRPVSFAEVSRAIAAGLAATLSIEWQAGPLSEAEQARAQALVAEKYGTPEWNHRA